MILVFPLLNSFAKLGQSQPHGRIEYRWGIYILWYQILWLLVLYITLTSLATWSWTWKLKVEL